MDNFNRKKKKQYQNRNREFLGIIICYENKYGEHLEPMSKDSITRYKGKHGLAKELSNKDVARHCIGYWNRTLRTGEVPRKLTAVHEEYRVTEFNKI